MHEKFAGSFLVVFSVLLSVLVFEYLCDSGVPRSGRSGVYFQVSTIMPRTPEDYLLLGQKIDINTAGAEVFDTLPGIGPSVAERIVRYREEHGPFGRIDDLCLVNGIGPKVLERIRPFLK